MRQSDLLSGAVEQQSFIAFFLVAAAINIAEHVLAKGSKKNNCTLFPNGDLWVPMKTPGDRIHKLNNLILRKEKTGDDSFGDDSYVEYKVQNLKDLRCPAPECNLKRISYASFEIKNETLKNTKEYQDILFSLLDLENSKNLLRFNEVAKKSRPSKRKKSPEKKAEDSSAKKNKAEDDEANAKAGSRKTESDEELDKAILSAERSATIRQLRDEARTAAASGSPTVHTTKRGRQSIQVKPFVSETGLKAVSPSKLSSSRARKAGKTGRQVMALVPDEDVKIEPPPRSSDMLYIWNDLANARNETERMKLI